MLIVKTKIKKKKNLRGHIRISKCRYKYIEIYIKKNIKRILK